MTRGTNGLHMASSRNRAPKRVAFIHGSNDLYGASRVLLTDVKILTDEGLEVTVVLPTAGPLNSLLTEAGAVVAIEPLCILRKVGSARQMRLPFVLPTAARSADIVVLWTLASASYLLASRLAGKFTLCSVHEILPGPVGRALRIVTRSLSDALMVNSHATNQWLNGISRTRATTVLAYPDAPAYAPLSLRPQHGAVSLLMAGRVNGHKGHLEAVEACSKARTMGLRDMRLTLMGGCYPGQEQHLESLLLAIADKPWAEYAGEVGDIAFALNDCDALLVPTTRPEPFGIVALEAWAAGRRVIAFDEGGLAEAARMVDGILVPPKDVQRLSEAIAGFARSPALRSPPSPDAEAAHRCTIRARQDAWHSVMSGV